MGLAYEITSNMYNTIYVSRYDITRNKKCFGNLASLNQRFAPRNVHAIARGLLTKSKHTSATNAVIYNLIACTFQNPEAHRVAWDEFWACTDKGQSVMWVLSGNCYTQDQLNRDEIVS